MTNRVHENYLQTEVLTADPVKLVRILYRAAIDAIGAARRHLQNGAIRERSRQITKAAEIINELMFSLDHEKGGEISCMLGRLYAYMQVRLIEANSRQTDPPLAEVQALLTTLLEAWCAVDEKARLAGHGPAPQPLPQQIPDHEQYVRRALG